MVDFPWTYHSVGERILSAVEDPEGLTLGEIQNIFKDESVSPDLPKALAEGLIDYYLSPSKKRKLLSLGMKVGDLQTISGTDGMAALHRRAGWLSEHAKKKWWRWDDPDEKRARFRDEAFRLLGQTASTRKIIREDFTLNACCQNTGSSLDVCCPKDGKERLKFKREWTSFHDAIELMTMAHDSDSPDHDDHKIFRDDYKILLSLLECCTPDGINLPLRITNVWSFGEMLCGVGIKKYRAKMHDDILQKSYEPVRLEAVESAKRMDPLTNESIEIRVQMIKEMSDPSDRALSFGVLAYQVTLWGFSSDRVDALFHLAFQEAIGNFSSMHKDVVGKLLYLLCRASHLLKEEEVFLKGVYTTKKDGTGERIFKGGSTTKIVAVFWNPSTQKTVIHPEDVELKFYQINYQGADEKKLEISLNAKPAQKKGAKIAVEARRHATLEFEVELPPEGRVYEVQARLANSLIVPGARVPISPTRSWRFSGDPYGVPEWIRFGQAAYLSDEGKGIFEDPLSWKPLFKKLAENGMQTVFVGMEYYHYSPLAGKKLKPFNYWMPAGGAHEKWDGHYTTPPDSLADSKSHFSIPWVDRSIRVYCERHDLNTEAGRFACAREKIRTFVKLAHQEGLKVMAYIDPVMIYNPDAKAKCWDPISRAHPKSEDSSFIRYCDGKPKRLSFQEDPISTVLDLNLSNPFDANCLQPSSFNLWNVSVSNFGNVPAFGDGTETVGIKAMDKEIVFSDDPAKDRTFWNKSDSYPDYLTRQMRWLTDPKGYDFDVIFADDAGRIKGRIGNDPASCRLSWREECLYGAKPSESSYFSGCDITDNEGEEATLANLMANVRAAIKKGRPEKALINQPYFLPWDSLSLASDVISTDQFDAASEGFARWAYESYERSLKPQRLDAAPVTLPTRHIPFAKEMHEVWDPSKKDLYRTVAYGWANRMPFWYGFGGVPPITREGVLDLRTLQYSRWFAENGKTGIVATLLHHSKLEKAWNESGRPLNETGEIELVKTFRFTASFSPLSSPFQTIGNDKMVYYTLYSQSSPIGESVRLLHVINEGNENAFLTFRVKVPKGNKVDSITIKTPDTLEGRPDVPSPPIRNTDVIQKGDFVEFEVPAFIYSLAEIHFTEGQ